MEEKKDIAQTILKWTGVVAAISALGIGTFVLEARHSIQNDAILEMIQSENAKTTDAINRQISGVRDSINIDLVRLTESTVKRDSILVIVLPKMTAEITDLKREVRSMKTVVNLNAAETPDDRTAQIWEYLQQREQIDSIYRRDMDIMRELRRINQMLQHKPKYGDRIE